MRHSNHGLRKLCICPRRSWAKCSHPWHFNYKPKGGKSYRFSLGQEFTDKTSAEREAARLRLAIDDGSYGAATPPRQAMTLRQLGAVYADRNVKLERWQAFTWATNPIYRTPVDGVPFGDIRVADINTDTVEEFARVRRPAGLPALNRGLSLLRAMFSWAVRKKVLQTTPFKLNHEVVIKLEEEAPRSRRLQEGEGDALFAACGPHLRAIVECALEAGMRKGEILSLQWKQIEGLDGRRPELVLPWRKTKTRKERGIPISSRLASILEMRRLDPAGQPMPPDAYVFGNEIGQRVRSVKRAWATAVLKSHGYTPAFGAKTKNLLPESRAALANIDLHFHDLRREAGSRWQDHGVPLGTISRWLGHSNVSQTSIYLSGTPESEHDAMRQYEERLQQIATGSETGGRKPLQSAVSRERKPNKTVVGRKTAIM